MLDLMPVSTAFAQFLLVGIFLLGFGAKVTNGEAFEGVVHNFRLLPRALVRPVAQGLPWVELAAGLGLLWAPVRPLAALGVLALLAVFTGAVAVNLARGRRDIDCGCFSSVLRQKLSGWLVARNAFLAALALWLATAPPSNAGMTWMEGFTGGAAALVAGLLYMAASQIANASHLNAARGSPRRG